MSRETRPRLGRGLSSLIRNSIADAAAAAGQYEAVAPAPVAPPAEKLPAAQIAAAHSAVAAAQPSALAADAPAAVDVLQTATLRADTVLPSASVTGVLSIPVERIQPNPCQPRRAFAAEALGELADSIRLHGVLEPLVVCVRAAKVTARSPVITWWRASGGCGRHNWPARRPCHAYCAMPAGRRCSNWP